MIFFSLVLRTLFLKVRQPKSTHICITTVGTLLVASTDLAISAFRNTFESRKFNFLWKFFAKFPNYLLFELFFGESTHSGIYAKVNAKKVIVGKKKRVLGCPFVMSLSNYHAFTIMLTSNFSFQIRFPYKLTNNLSSLFCHVINTLHFRVIGSTHPMKSWPLCRKIILISIYWNNNINLV